jgi:hypothetical protein
MNKITNIKVNYMLLEQILRVTGAYKTLCDEHEFLDVIFKQAKTGKLDDLFTDDYALETAIGIIENITGVSAKYWLGNEKIKLGIRCNNEDLSLDDESIDTVDLENDNPYFEEIEGNEKLKDKADTINNNPYFHKIKSDDKLNDTVEHEDENTTIYKNEIHNYPYGKLYSEQLKNPLHLDSDEICDKVSKIELSESEIEEAIKIIETLYSLRGMLIVLLLNMANEIELIDKANVYKHKKWEPYIRILEKPTKHGITYSPRFIEIRKGLVQTIIKNIYDLGIVFTFRDLDKEFIMK